MNVNKSTKKTLLLMPLIVTLSALTAYRQSDSAANAQLPSVAVKVAVVQSSRLAASMPLMVWKYWILRLRWFVIIV